MIRFFPTLACVIFAALLFPSFAVAQAAPEMPKFGKPGEVIHYARVALTHRAQATHADGRLELSRAVTILVQIPAPK